MQHRIQVFNKLLDDHTIMAHSLFAQHRIGYRNQRLNSQFSALSAAQSHSTSGTRHVLLRLRRFSPLSYVNDYWATVQFIRQYKHCEHHAPTNNQDSLTRSICEKAGYDQHNFLNMTPLSHRHRNSHEDIPKPYTTGARSRVALAAVLVVIELPAEVQEVVVHPPS